MPRAAVSLESCRCAAGGDRADARAGFAQGVASGLRMAPRCREAQTRFPELPQESRSARQLFARRRLAAFPRAGKRRIALDSRPAVASPRIRGLHAQTRQEPLVLSDALLQVGLGPGAADGGLRRARATRRCSAEGVAAGLP